VTNVGILAIGDVIKFEDGPYKGLLARLTFREDASSKLTITLLLNGKSIETTGDECAKRGFERREL